MTIYELQETLRQKVWEMARSMFDIDIGQVVSEIPPKIELGDAAFPAAFELAKLIKQKTGEKSHPREIAETLKAELEKFDFVDHIEVAGPGYLNVFYDRVKFIGENTDSQPLPKLSLSESANSQKICVEHTSVNPNKA
ncbi:MAG: hypothetical protein WBD16_10905, partial [Pyrinomonadaceae bacterium]